MVYNREFNGRQLMSPICRLIDFSVRTFCSTGGWNCAAVSNDGLGFMRVVGRAQSMAGPLWLLSEFSELSIVRRERPLGSKHRGPTQEQPGVREAMWRRQQDQATQISLCSLMVNILSCGLAWPETARELFHSPRRVQCLLLLTRRWWHWGQHSPGHWQYQPPPPPTWAIYCRV